MPACGGARCVFNQDTTAKLIHNCWDKNQQSALGQFSIGRVGQFSISANIQRVGACCGLEFFISQKIPTTLGVSGR